MNKNKLDCTYMLLEMFRDAAIIAVLLERYNHKKQQQSVAQCLSNLLLTLVPAVTRVKGNKEFLERFLAPGESWKRIDLEPPLFPPDGSHWPDSQNSLFTLEATGYALLTLVKLKLMNEAELPFKWLNSQRRRGGGFGSTQVTDQHIFENPTISLLTVCDGGRDGP